MTTKKYGRYLKFVAKEHNILLVSDQSFVQFEKLKGQFNIQIQKNMSENELNNLTLTLMENKIDIIMLDFTKNAELAKEFKKIVVDYNNRIIIIALLNKKSIEKELDILHTFDSTLFDDFSVEELEGRIFLNLSVYYAIKAIANQKSDVEAISINDDLNTFFDMYEGSSLFVVDELTELNKRLKAGELSVEILESISRQAKELSDIFSHHKDTKDVVDILENFQKFINDLDLSKIDPSSLYAFDYLTAIIDDVNAYMIKMFVKRVLNNSYIFEHSCQNNLDFMIDALSSQKDVKDKSELEFF